MQTYDDAAIAQELTGALRRWRHDHGALCRIYRTSSWQATVMAFNAIAHLCEQAWHHPDMRATFNSLELRLNTHDAGGITDRDFELAARIEAQLQWRPTDASALGQAQKGRTDYIALDD